MLDTVIITEPIDDTYSWGAFGDFRVIVAVANGYVNGTHLAVGLNQSLEEWLEEDTTAELLQFVAGNTGIPAADLMETVKSSSAGTVVRGTYLHPKLVIHLAQWCSPEYAYKVTEIVQDYHAREHRERAKAEKKERKRLEKKLAKRDEKLDRKRVKISDLKEMLQQMEQQAQAREVRSDTKMNRLHDRVDDIQSDLSQVSRKLDVAKRDRVLSTGDPAYENILILLKLNQDPKLFEKGIIPFEYTPLRVTAQSRNACLARKQKAFPKSEIVLELSGTPSAMALWRYYKKQYGHRIDWTGFYFYLRRGYTERDLIDDLRSAHENRLSDIGLA